MIEVVFRKVRPDKEDRLRAWLKELNERTEEVLQTFEQETVRHERGYIINTSDGPILAYIMEAEDHDRAREAFQHSALRIDREHKQVMAEVLSDPVDAELLYECAIPPPEKE
jgi:K+/H+ antiporter YhaU regulatory subunit KhtT